LNVYGTVDAVDTECRSAERPVLLSVLRDATWRPTKS